MRMFSVIATVVAVVVALFAWGFTRLRRRAADAADLITSVREDQVHWLAQECIRTFRDRLDTQLSLDDFDASVAGLEAHVNRGAFLHMESVFEKPEHPGWAVLPVGAFIGSLVGRHCEGRWIPAEGGGLAMEVGSPGKTITFHPFDKVSKQKWTGDPGDLTAWFEMLRLGPEAIAATLAQQENPA